jgi:hypothetical protein
VSSRQLATMYTQYTQGEFAIPPGFHGTDIAYYFTSYE